jgi:hypothetical protein
MELLSNNDRLGRALNNLSRSILNKSGQAYILDTKAASRIQQKLSAKETILWKCQALITAYRAILWKYIKTRFISRFCLKSN